MFTVKELELIELLVKEAKYHSPLVRELGDKVVGLIGKKKSYSLHKSPEGYFIVELNEGVNNDIKITEKEYNFINSKIPFLRSSGKKDDVNEWLSVMYDLYHKENLNNYGVSFEK